MARAKKVNESSERFAWKVLTIAFVVVVVAVIFTGLTVGLALRSGSIAIPPFLTWLRIGTLLCLAMLIAGALLIRAGFLDEGLRLPIVRASAPLMVYGLGLLFTGVHANRQYFSSAAEIIPVLLLTLAVEGRAFSLRQLPTDDWIGKELLKISALGTMSILASGEAFALIATTQDVPSHLLTGVVAGALAAGFAGVMLFSVLDLFSERPHSDLPTDQSQ